MKQLLFLFFVLLPVHATFPMGRCYDKMCSSSPYTLDISSNNGSKMCFKIVSQPCTNTKYNCCDKFNKELFKIILSSRPECSKSVGTVTVNNVTKRGGVYFDLYLNKTYGELRLTNLKMSQNVALTSEVCINFKDVCNTFDVFKGLAKWAVFDPHQHTCCPTCSFTSLSLPPPPLPPRPPPSPCLYVNPMGHCNPPLPPPPAPNVCNCSCL